MSTNSILACMASQCMNKNMQCCKALFKISWHVHPTIEWYNILTHLRGTVCRGSRGTCLYGGLLTVSLRQLVVCVYIINKCEYGYTNHMKYMINVHVWIHEYTVPCVEVVVVAIMGTSCEQQSILLLKQFYTYMHWHDMMWYSRAFGETESVHGRKCFAYSWYTVVASTTWCPMHRKTTKRLTAKKTNSMQTSCTELVCKSTHDLFCLTFTDRWCCNHIYLRPSHHNNLLHLSNIHDASGFVYTHTQTVANLNRYTCTNMNTSQARAQSI